VGCIICPQIHHFLHDIYTGLIYGTNVHMTLSQNRRPRHYTYKTDISPKHSIIPTHKTKTRPRRSKQTTRDRVVQDRDYIPGLHTHWHVSQSADKFVPVAFYWACSDDTVHYKSDKTVNLCGFRCATKSPITVSINVVFYIYICCFYCLVCRN